MKSKSTAAQILTMVVMLIGVFGVQYSGTTAAILGIVSMALTLILTTAFPSGEYVGKGWSVVTWATNVGGIVTQILIATTDAGLMAATVTSSVIAVINIIIQVWFTNKVDASRPVTA